MIDHEKKERHLKQFETCLCGLPDVLKKPVIENMALLWDRAFETGLKEMGIIVDPITNYWRELV